MKPELYPFQTPNSSSDLASVSHPSSDEPTASSTDLVSSDLVSSDLVSSALARSYSFKLSPRKTPTPNHAAGKTVQPFPLQALSARYASPSTPPSPPQPSHVVPASPPSTAQSTPPQLTASAKTASAKTASAKTVTTDSASEAPTPKRASPTLLTPSLQTSHSSQLAHPSPSPHPVPVPVSSTTNGAQLLPVMQILREIEATVLHWQEELNQLLVAIQSLYDEGPIVDGWLETHTREPKGSEAKLRHIDLNLLKDYVDDICNRALNRSNRPISPKESYSLCGLDEDGNLWSYPCPLEQLPTVSAAIARYHRLRELQNRKQYLETNLNQLTNTLMALYTRIK